MQSIGSNELSSLAADKSQVTHHDWLKSLCEDNHNTHVPEEFKRLADFINGLKTEIKEKDHAIQKFKEYYEFLSIEHTAMSNARKRSNDDIGLDDNPITKKSRELTGLEEILPANLAQPDLVLRNSNLYDVERDDQFKIMNMVSDSLVNEILFQSVVELMEERDQQYISLKQNMNEMEAAHHTALLECKLTIAEGATHASTLTNENDILQKQLNETQYNLIQMTMSKQDELKQLEEGKKNLEIQLQASQSEKGELMLQIREITELNEQYRSESVQMANKHANLTENNSQLKMELETVSTELDGYVEGNKHLKDKLDESNIKLDSVGQLLEQSSSELLTLQQSKVMLENTVNDLNETIVVMKEQSLVCNADVGRITNDLYNDKVSELENALTKISELNITIENNQMMLEKAAEHIETLCATNDQLQGELLSIRTDLQAKFAYCEDLETKLLEAEDERAKQMDSLDSLRAELLKRDEQNIIEKENYENGLVAMANLNETQETLKALKEQLVQYENEIKSISEERVGLQQTILAKENTLAENLERITLLENSNIELKLKNSDLVSALELNVSQSASEKEELLSEKEKLSADLEQTKLILNDSETQQAYLLARVEELDGLISSLTTTHDNALNQISDLKSNEENYQSMLEKAGQHIETLCQTNDDLAEQLEKVKNEVNDNSKELEIEEKLKILGEHAANLESQVVLLKNEKAAVQDKYHALTSEYTELHDQEVEIAKKLNECTLELQNVKELLLESDSKNVEYEMQIHNLSNKAKELDLVKVLEDEKISNLQNSNDELLSQLNDCKEKLFHLELSHNENLCRLSQLNSTKTADDARFETLQSELDSLRVEYKNNTLELSNQLEELERDKKSCVSQAMNDISALNMELNRKHSELENMAKEYTSVNYDNEQLKRNLEHLENQIASLTSSTVSKEVHDNYLVIKRRLNYLNKHPTK
ncbi:hypothetical protein BC833DRAFT_8400 [Globomyces pollinis-pini]|nr:hypothetical protein BC833DRAFT_8400 [Globomyces pollinis-pini]